MSPIYIDLRVTVSYPEVLKMVAEAMWEKVHPVKSAEGGAPEGQFNGVKFDLICGVPYTALPIATAISLAHNIPMIMRRKEVKDYGTKKAIEGKFEVGQNCLVIEDLVTSGASVFETIEPLQLEGLKVTDIIVLVDREQGGKKHITEKGYNLYSVLTISEMLNTLAAEGKLDAEMVKKVKEFIKNNQV